MVKKSDKETIKELKKELEFYKEQHRQNIEFNRKMYAVELSIWEGGSGSCQTLALCRELKDAVVVREGLRKVIPEYHGSECGDSKIHRNNKLQIRACHISDVKSFVKGDRW